MPDFEILEQGLSAEEAGIHQDHTWRLNITNIEF
jgi:hypothetical protein